MSYSHNCLFIGKVLIKKDSIDSSNNYAKQLLSNSKPIEGTAILTEFQSEGRGQRDSIWQSNPGENITLSIILYPNIKTEQYFLLNEMISLGIRDAISNFLPTEDIQIKWPNDILVNNKKIAGILIENNISNGVIISSVVGIGLNVNQTSFKENIAANSMKLVSHKDFDIEKVIDNLFSSIEHAYLLGKRNIAFIKSTYCQYLYGYKKQMEVIHLETDIVLKGQIENVREDGILDFLTITGQHYFFNFKEIKFLLP
jgi:BirA family biotin operon repressor/biotin-[acetyl-CoA-carboxylase] ligase